MPKLYENFQSLHFQKRIVSAETILGNTVCFFESIPVLYCNDDLSSMVTFCDLGLVVYNTVWYSYSAQWVKILSEGALSF